MASYSAARAVHKTLTSTTVDTVTLTGQDIKTIEVTNRSGTSTLFFTTNGVDPTANGDDTDHALPGDSVLVRPRSSDGSGNQIVKVIGNANDYSVVVVD